MIRWLILLLTFATACSGASPDEKAAWQADFEALLDHMSSVYANLDWAQQERGIDVYAAAETARAELAKAGSRRAARRAVQKFVMEFQDPHFRVIEGISEPQGGGEPPALARTTTADKALKRMGFRGRDLSFRLDFDRLDGFETVRVPADNPFVLGRLRLANGARVGLIRIAHFGDDGYPEVAKAMWADFAASLADDCELACQWEFRFQVMNRLLEHLAAATRTLTELGIDALLIDLVQNGGGSDWAAVAPRLFAPPLTNCPKGGVIRHPHHADSIRRQLGDLEEVLADSSLGSTSRRLVEVGRAQLEASLAATDSSCDRRAIFDRANYRPDCSQIHVLSGCGVLEYLAPGSLADLPARGALFWPLDFQYEEGLWTGPLFVLIDGGTASASEQFLALLEANSAATFLGQRSYGAGCGYYGGGVPAKLRALDLTVLMSDCIRFRADGRNELDGIEPHVPIEWGGGDHERARRVQLELERLLPAPIVGDPERDRAAIQAASAEFSRAFVDGDTTALGLLYTPQAKILPLGRELQGQAAIRRYFAPRSDRRQLAHRLDCEALRIDGASAWDRGRWFSVTQRGDAAPDSAAGRYEMLWRRQSDGTWRIAMDVWR